METTTKFIGFTALIVLTFVVLKFSGVNSLSNFKFNSDSETASKVKTHLSGLAESLINADKIGDKQAALKIAIASGKLFDQFNDLPEQNKQKILNSELRYCHLASINLFDGAEAVANGGHWLEKDRFFSSINQCH